MTLNSTGPMSLAGTVTGESVEVELNESGSVAITINDSNVRTLLGVASGAIALSNAYGKSNRVSIGYTFTTNTANASLNVTAISGYLAGKSDITVTVNAGVYLYATATSNAGLTLTGGTTGDTLTLVNNGFIIGQGGAGGSAAGGPALSLGFPTTINNKNTGAYIAGGGGGGAGRGGGGAGGGAGASGSAGAGGAGGGPGAGGATAAGVYPGYGGGAGGGGGGTYAYSGSCVSGSCCFGGGGGGRVLPGGGGGGGGGDVCPPGGAGGSANAGGGYGTTGGGGGWGAAGGPRYCYYNGAVGASVGGKAIQLNGYSVTYSCGVTCRVWGAVA